MADTTVLASPSVSAAPAFGQTTDAGLKELVGSNPKETSDPVEIAHSQSAALIEKLIHP